jgi:hypothetical protein
MENKPVGKCYAAALGNCNGISREHYYSEAILSQFFPQLQIEGFTFNSASHKSLCSKILCQTHNSSLAPLDSEALHFFSLLRNISLNKEIIASHQINGKLLERWFLKTLLGLLAAKQIKIDMELSCHKKLINILYGNQPWDESTGLHFVFPENRFEIDTTLGNSIIAKNCYLFRICNLHFVLTTENVSVKDLLPNYKSGYRSKGLTFQQRTDLSIEIDFQWNENSTN